MDAPSAISRDLHAESNVESISIDSESDTASLLGNAILDQDVSILVVEPLGSLSFSAEARAAMSFTDTCEMEGEFLDRACVMKSPPAFLKGASRSAMRFALDEVDTARARGHHVGLSRAWKLFMLLPRLLLHKPPRGGLVPKSHLRERFVDFAAGRWERLLDASRACVEQAAVASRRRRRRREDDIQRRADRAHALVQMGELSAGRHALEGAALAPGTDATRRALSASEASSGSTGASSR